MIKYLLIFIFATIFFSCNNENNKSNKPAAPSLSKSDQQLMNDAYRNLLLSTKMAEEAINRSTAAETKELANSIMKEHHSMMSQLEIIAGKHSAELPMDINASQLNEWQDLVREKGIAFDKKYATIIEKKHQDQFILFTNIKQQAANQDLQSVSDSFLNLVESHKRQGMDLMDILNNRRSRDTASIMQEVSVQQ